MMTVETIRKFNDLEFRKTDFLSKDGHYYEIVRWEKDTGEVKLYCYTLLQWLINSEGWDIEFIGNRPFEYITQDAINAEMSVEKFWAFLEFCQSYLDNEFRFEENLKW